MQLPHRGRLVWQDQIILVNEKDEQVFLQADAIPKFLNKCLIYITPFPIFTRFN